MSRPIPPSGITAQIGTPVELAISLALLPALSPALSLLLPPRQALVPEVVAADFLAVAAVVVAAVAGNSSHNEALPVS